MTSGSAEDEKNRSVATDYQHQQPPHPPPFQGVSNYPPPQQHQPPPPGYPQPQPAQPYVSGYAVNGVTEYDRLPCCGIGIGWLLFILGFFFGAIPWYIGFFLFLFSKNPRERPGYIACAIASVIATIIIVLGATRGSGAW